MTTTYLTAEQDKALKKLSRATRVPVAEYIREGADLVLAKYLPVNRANPFAWIHEVSE